jgi:hypothetical protein
VAQLLRRPGNSIPGIEVAAAPVRWSINEEGTPTAHARAYQGTRGQLLAIQGPQHLFGCRTPPTVSGFTVSAPKTCSHSWPSTFEAHDADPGRIGEGDRRRVRGGSISPSVYGSRNEPLRRRRRLERLQHDEWAL